MKLPHTIKTAGYTHAMIVDSLSSLCGDIIKGISVYFTDGAGSFVIDVDDLRAIVQAADEEYERSKDDRCAVCGWFMEKRKEDGCVRGNCCQRPRPKVLFDPGRAAAESRKGAGKSALRKVGQP